MSQPMFRHIPPASIWHKFTWSLRHVPRSRRLSFVTCLEIVLLVAVLWHVALDGWRLLPMLCVALMVGLIVMGQVALAVDALHALRFSRRFHPSVRSAWVGDRVSP